MLSDRDVLSGLCSLVAALAEKVTGEVPRVRFKDAEGNKYFSIGTDAVEWISQHTGAESCSDAALPACLPKSSESPCKPASETQAAV